MSLENSMSQDDVQGFIFSSSVSDSYTLTNFQCVYHILPALFDIPDFVSTGLNWYIQFP